MFAALFDMVNAALNPVSGITRCMLHCIADPTQTKKCLQSSNAACLLLRNAHPTHTESMRSAHSNLYPAFTE